jgi:TetR/AcrR family transcriptional regulator, mexJK operon transcriptional repressor
MAQILNVAREQFSLHGYRAVTMQGVADKADVSTRTLYNRYADKLSLFAACLDSGSDVFPLIRYASGSDVAETLRIYTVELVMALSTDSSTRLSMLVYREGAEFPELVRAAEANQQRHLVDPVAAYMRQAGLSDEANAEVRAKLFIALAISDWQRRISFLRPLPTRAETKDHAERVVELFLNGAQVRVR